MPAKAKPKAPGPSRGKPRTAVTKATTPRKTATRPKAKKAGVQAKPILEGPDWRAASIDRVRALIKQADPGVVEEVKWRKPSNGMQGVATWSHDGLICTGETYKDKVKFTFARGAALADPTGLFNADDRGSTRRAIDLRAGEMVDPAAFKALVGEAVAHNAARRAGGA